MASTGGPKAPAFFVFASEQLDYDRYDIEQQKALLRKAYEGGRWRIPELMAKLARAEDVYLDSLSLVKIDNYAKGRVVLLGDAAYGNTLGGFGTGLAMVGAYVLAGELLAAGGDHRVAFERYEEQLRKYAAGSSKSNAGPFLAPPSKWRMGLRNLIFKSGFLLGLMLKIADKFATDIDLKEYPALVRMTG
jgi:2-polyprenyl-6-methoxyphenol hydroxylase-like FAD-dependent oxidoreductase